MFNRIKMSESSLMDLSIFTIHYLLTKTKIIFRPSFIRRTHIYFIAWLPWFSILHMFSYFYMGIIIIRFMWAYGLHILLKNKHGIQNKCKDKEIGLLWHVVDGSLSDRPRFHTFLNSAFNLSCTSSMSRNHVNIT